VVEYLRVFCHVGFFRFLDGPEMAQLAWGELFGNGGANARLKPLIQILAFASSEEK